MMNMTLEEGLLSWIFICNELGFEGRTENELAEKGEFFPAWRIKMFQGHECANMLMSKHEVRSKASRSDFLEEDK